ncbi:MAG TPA: stage III sporulation protein AG [Clostridiaceae bacterium]
MDFKKLKSILEDKLKSKNVGNLFILALVGILIVLGAGVFNDTTKTNKVVNNNNSDSTSVDSSILNYENSKKNELVSILEEIAGVGNVDVMLHIDSSEEQVPAVNSNTSKSETNQKDMQGSSSVNTTDTDGSTIVVTNDDNGSTSPLIIKKYYPRISGVVIAAQGANDEGIRLQIIQAVTSLFGMTDDKVNVYPMKK